MANTSPIYDPGQAITGKATGAAVTGGRFVKVASAKSDGEATPVAHCGASDIPLGVAGADAAENALTPVYGDGFVMPVEASANVNAAVEVEVDAAGKVKTYSSGRKVGVTLTAGSTSVAPLVRINIR